MAFSAIGPSGFICLPRGPSSAIGRIGGGGSPPLLLDLFNSSLAMVLATCALGGSGVGYLTVEANDASLLGGWGLGVAIANSCGFALRDLDLSRASIGGAGGGGGGGGWPDDTTIGSLQASYLSPSCARQTLPWSCPSVPKSCPVHDSDLPSPVQKLSSGRCVVGELGAMAL